MENCNAVIVKLWWYHPIYVWSSLFNFTYAFHCQEILIATFSSLLFVCNGFTEIFWVNSLTIYVRCQLKSHTSKSLVKYVWPVNGCRALNPNQSWNLFQPYWRWRKYVVVFFLFCFEIWKPTEDRECVHEDAFSINSYCPELFISYFEIYVSYHHVLWI